MKKVIQILLICLIIAGIVVISTVGFNVGLKYSEHKEISININKEFNVSDIRNITKEVFGNKPMIIQQVELYKDMVQISVKEASEEQVSSLNDKINEKYGLENAISDVKVVDIPNVRLRNVIKPYILPVSIVSVLTIIFAMIVYRKLGVWKVLYDTAMAIVAPQAILSSLYAVTRIPINRIATIVAISVFALSITMIILKLNITKQKLFKEKEDSKKVEKG
jgi:protein-export membrane protein secF